jgi:hypothetical protein
MAAGADDDVVEDGDVEQPPGLDQLGRHGDVLARGRGVAAGVVVDDDERRAVVADGLLEDLPDAQVILGTRYSGGASANSSMPSSQGWT